MNVPNRQRGFTLLEILAAFAVLALVGSAMLQLFQGGLHNLAVSDDYTRAAMLAESQLARLRSQHGLAPGSLQGEIEPGYQYHLELSNYQDESGPSLGLLAAHLQIHWDDGARERNYTVDTLLLAPNLAKAP